MCSESPKGLEDNGKQLGWMKNPIITAGQITNTLKKVGTSVSKSTINLIVPCTGVSLQDVNHRLENRIGRNMLKKPVHFWSTIPLTYEVNLYQNDETCTEKLLMILILWHGTV